MSATFVRYSPSVENPIEDEEQVHRDLMDTMRSIEGTTSKDYDHAVRAVHAKAHGVFRGELTVASDLPAELAQGLFASPGTYQVVMRLSTQPGDILDDAVSAARGMAVKVLDVPGERLPDSQGEQSQNFVLASDPAFAAPDAKKFLGSLKQLAATTDKAEWAKKALSATFPWFRGRAGGGRRPERDAEVDGRCADHAPAGRQLLQPDRVPLLANTSQSSRWCRCPRI